LFVDEPDRHSTLADGRGYPLDRSVADVADGEQQRQVGDRPHGRQV